MKLLRASASACRFLYATRRRYSVSSSANASASTARRVIGIIAHIDAGKTTTTERFLFAASARRHLGDVDSGDTATDFLPEEIRRGITIKAAVTHCAYRDVAVDIVDTPGHVDFGVEVVSSLRAVDGAVMILDAVRGVEAQTRTVYRHADDYALPVVAVINKCDRDGADVEKTVAQMSRTFRRQSLPLHIPIFDSQSIFVGAVDAVSGDEFRWSADVSLPAAKRLTSFTRTALDHQHSDAQRLRDYRDRIMETLAEYDDEMMQNFVGERETIWDARMIGRVRTLIRSLTCSRLVIPVLVMSAKQCIGIQPLLDAVIDFLPAPNEAPPFKVKRALLEKIKRSRQLTTAAANEERRINRAAPLLVFVFKTAFDITRGAAVSISHVRVCGGILNAKDVLINTRNGARERPLKLVTIDGANVKDAESVSAGEVAALIGLKETNTADTLCRYDDKEPVRMSGISSGASVFFLNITAERRDDEDRLRHALTALCREDPSLTVNDADDGSGAMTVGGFGELHLEVTVNRIRNDFKLAVSVSDIAVNFAETVQHKVTVAAANTLSAPEGADERARIASAVAIRLTLQPMAEAATADDDDDESAAERGNHISIERAIAMTAADASALLDVSDWSGQTQSAELTALFAAAIHDGIAAELSRGPLFALAIHQTQVRVDSVFISANASPHSIKMAAISAVKSALMQTDKFAIIEPVMRVVVSVRREHVGAVANDLTAIRRGQISNIDSESTEDVAEVVADVPLMEMLGYASALRSLTGGDANFSMSAHSYAVLPRSKYKSVRRY